MDYHKEVDTAFNVLDFALQEYYADDPDVSGIYYDPVWMEAMKDAMVSTERIKGESASNVIENILQLFDLTTKKVDDCIIVHRYQPIITVI